MAGQGAQPLPQPIFASARASRNSDRRREVAARNDQKGRVLAGRVRLGVRGEGCAPIAGRCQRRQRLQGNVMLADTLPHGMQIRILRRSKKSAKARAHCYLPDPVGGGTALGGRQRLQTLPFARKVMQALAARSIA